MAPDTEHPFTDSGRFTQEALVALIDSRFNHNIERWYTLYWQPMHNENKTQLAEIKGIVSNIVAKMNHAEGGFATAKASAQMGWALIVGIAAVAAFIVGHFWK